MKGNAPSQSSFDKKKMQTKFVKNRKVNIKRLIFNTEVESSGSCAPFIFINQQFDDAHLQFSISTDI